MLRCTALVYVTHEWLKDWMFGNFFFPSSLAAVSIKKVLNRVEIQRAV